MIGHATAAGLPRYMRWPAWVVNGVAHNQYLAGVSDAPFDLSYANNLAETNTGHLVNSRTMFNDAMGVFSLLRNMPDDGIQVQTGLREKGHGSKFECP